MICENKIGGHFDNLAQRVIYAYMVSYSGFIPIHDNEVSEEAQKAMHSFLYETLCRIYDDPALIQLPIEPDGYFNGEFYKEKPELNEAMKKLEKKFLEFFGFLFELGDAGIVKDNKLSISKAAKKILRSKFLQLEQLGLKSELTDDAVIIYSEKYPELCSGWKLLCEACKKAEGSEIIKNPVISQGLTRLMFMRCIFDVEKISWTSLYGDLEQSGPFLKELEEYFINKGYSNRFHDASFKLQKAYANKQEGAFSIRFDWRCKNQLGYSVAVPGFRELMKHFDEMKDELKELIFSRTGVCRNCGYCTQTDKTGKRKPAAIELEYRGETAQKCPLFPYLTWGELNEKTVSVIKDLFNFAEDTLYR